MRYLQYKLCLNYIRYILFNESRLCVHYAHDKTILSIKSYLVIKLIFIERYILFNASIFCVHYVQNKPF